VITSPVGGIPLHNLNKVRLRPILFAICTTVGAALTGAMCAAIGRFVLGKRGIYGVLILSVAFALAYGFAELRKLDWKVPTRHWLIPKGWAAYGTPRFEMIFGLILGAGFLTVIPFIGYYLLIAYCLTCGAIAKASAAMAVFGALRAIPTLAIPAFFKWRFGTYDTGMACEANRWIALAGDTPLVSRLRAMVLFLSAGASVSNLVTMLDLTSR
jgi:hypothetical protein